MKFYIFITFSILLTGCANNFTRADFKYSNIAHMNYREAMTEISTPPEEFIFDISDAFRKHGATILERKKIDFFITENSFAQKCWEANYSICQKEFTAYRSNDFKMYKAIDREKPFSTRNLTNDCSYFTNSTKPGTDSWFLLVEFPPRSAQTIIYRPSLNSFFVFNPDIATHGFQGVQGFSTSQHQEQVRVNISTRLYVWAWKESNATNTNIYLMAKPISGQIEAAPGNSIGYSWWQQANGYSELQVVKNYISLIQEYDHYKKQSAQR